MVQYLHFRILEFPLTMVVFLSIASLAPRIQSGKRQTLLWRVVPHIVVKHTGCSGPLAYPAKTKQQNGIIFQVSRRKHTACPFSPFPGLFSFISSLRTWKGLFFLEVFVACFGWSPQQLCVNFGLQTPCIL